MPAIPCRSSPAIVLTITRQISTTAMLPVMDKLPQNRYSARPGHSEHQSGLAMDVGAIDNNYGNTPAGKWLAEHCADYGFILRYPQGKENITGYMYEPWHIRYVGVQYARGNHEFRFDFRRILRCRIKKSSFLL